MNIATNIEQSKHLVELGLDPKSADMWWVYVDEEEPYLVAKTRDLDQEPDRDTDKVIPAWSLSALLELTPYPMLSKDNGWCCVTPDYAVYGDTPIQAAYEMVCWLVENGYIETTKSKEL